MREYDGSEVEFLQKQGEVLDVHGAKVLVKPSPTEPRPGCLDHHELAILSAHWVAREESEEEKAEKAGMTPEEALQAMRDGMGFPNRNLCREEIHTKFETIRVGENEVGLWRYYTRKSQRKPGKPCLVFLHGGGWVGGTPYTVENPCRLLAELADAVVFNVDYSLAPEKKFPNGFDDCFGAVQHIYEHAEEYGIDRNKIAVGGDSAGGNLTAAIALKDRDLGTHMVALQVLIYPCVTFLYTGNPGYRFDINEYEMCEEQKDIVDQLISIGRPASEDDDRVQMEGMYLTNREAAYHPYVSPLLALSHKGVARALCVSAEFDGLRLQTEHYGKVLAEDGVPVKTIRYCGVAHAFIDKLGFVPQAEDLCIEIAKAMKEM